MESLSRKGIQGELCLGISISILTRTLGMEFLHLGRSFGENLGYFFPLDPHLHPHRGSRNGSGENPGYFPRGSPPPSSPRLQEWNCSPQGGILGTIIPRGSPFPSSPGLQGRNLSLRVEFGGNSGYYSTFPSHPPHPSPPPPSPLGYSLNFPGYPKGHHRPNREAKLPSFPIPALPGRDFPLPAPKTPLRGHGGGTLGTFCHLSRRGKKKICGFLLLEL